MKIAVRLFCLMLASIASISVASAQSAQDARITISHPGFKSLKTDLKVVLDLTLPAEKAQWENIEGYIDTFRIGIDESRPVYVSVLTGVKPNALLIFVPLAATNPLFKEFRENLESLGYEVSRDSKDHSLFELNQDPDFGLLRILPDIKYAVFVLTTDKAALPILKELLLKAKLPEVKLDSNMMAELENPDVTAEAQKHRKGAFGETRRVSMEAIQKRPAESATEFELRKLAVKQQMDEGERLMSDASKIVMVLNVDKKNPAAPTASLKVSANAIAGTSLHDAIAQIGAQPDAFASLAKFGGSALSGRLNHPIDPMRQQNIIAFLALTEEDMANRLKASKELTDAEKEMSKKVTTGVLDVVRGSIKAGWINAFVESVPDGKGDFVSLAAFSTPLAGQLNNVLPDLVKAEKNNVVQMNIDKQGDVAIHRVQIAEGYIDLMDKLFGAKKDIFVGVGPAHVWLASGADAKEKLKQTIASLGQPAASPSPLHVEVKVLPWVQRFDEIAKKDPPGKTPEEQELQRESARNRARAIASCQAGGDMMILDFQVANGEVKGELSVETGLMRFAGKVMSAFSKANFE